MFDLGPTPDDPMEIIDADISIPSIHLYNGKKNAQPWIAKKTVLGKVLIPLKDIPNRVDIPVPENNGYIVPHIPKMDPLILDQALAFFRHIFDTRTTEAALLLALDEKSKYHLYAPEQKVDYSGVDYTDKCELAEGHFIVGSIHSHCDFDAFHSGTDTGDAANNDGLHITLGHIDRDEDKGGISQDTMIVFSGIRWEKWDLDTITETKWVPTPYPEDKDLEIFPIDWTLEVEESVFSKYQIGFVGKNKPKSKSDKDSGWKGQYSSQISQYIWDEYDDDEEWLEYVSAQADDDELLSWDRYGIGHTKSGKKYDPELTMTERINSDWRHYSADPKEAREQMLKDLADLVELAFYLDVNIQYTAISAEGTGKEDKNA